MQVPPRILLVGGVDGQEANYALQHLTEAVNFCGVGYKPTQTVLVHGLKSMLRVVARPVHVPKLTISSQFRLPKGRTGMRFHSDDLHPIIG